MSSNVFANGREVSAKNDDNQSIAAMPDVCLSPPSPPAGPIPIPYPNFSQASDTSSGTKTVKIGGQEVGIKNESNYKTSKGDEAATRGLGMGVVTHTIQGKTKFSAWSFDVKFEGSNAVRFLDLTTHNHANPVNTACLTASQASAKMDPPPPSDCEELDDANEEDRETLSKSPELSPEERDVVAGPGSTIANFKFRSPGGQAMVAAGTNRNESSSVDENHFKRGASRGQRVDKESNLCEEADFKYRGKEGSNFTRPSGHAESRIVETIFDAKPQAGVLLINVDLVKKRLDEFGDPIESKLPCSHCHRLLCAAKKCGIRIFLCDNAGKPQEMREEMCEKDTNDRVSDTNRDKMKSLLGEK